MPPAASPAWFRTSARHIAVAICRTGASFRWTSWCPFHWWPTLSSQVAGTCRQRAPRWAAPEFRACSCPQGSWCWSSWAPLRTWSLSENIAQAFLLVPLLFQQQLLERVLQELKDESSQVVRRPEIDVHSVVKLPAHEAYLRLKIHQAMHPRALVNGNELAPDEVLILIVDQGQYSNNVPRGQNLVYLF